MYHILFVHLFVDGHLGCLHVLTTGNSATENIGMHLSFQITVLSGYMLISGISGSYGGSTNNFDF